jgi:hypothetical protein
MGSWTCVSNLLNRMRIYLRLRRRCPCVNGGTCTKHQVPSAGLEHSTSEVRNADTSAPMGCHWKTADGTAGT